LGFLEHIPIDFLPAYGMTYNLKHTTNSKPHALEGGSSPMNQENKPFVWRTHFWAQSVCMRFLLELCFLELSLCTFSANAAALIVSTV